MFLKADVTVLLPVLGVPMLAKVTAPGAAEAGDMVWLDAQTLFIGHGYRTNHKAFRRCDLLKPKRVECLGTIAVGPGPRLACT